MSEEEQANPTSYPLPNEEVAAHLHGQTPEKYASASSRILDKNPELLKKMNSKYPPFISTKPAHYNDTTPTALQVIDAWGLNFRLGNTLKYIARHRKKGSPIADLEKAMEYLRLEVERLKAA